MRCLKPRTVGFKNDGKTLQWNVLKINKEYPTFQMPCGQCIECRLEYARQWAIRCMHEAQMHEDNIFLTLTYNDENLPEKLKYEHIQEFLKRLRSKIEYKYYLNNNLTKSELSKEQQKIHRENYEISFFVTGEYGDRTKRPHWHIILFNYRPEDAEYLYTTDLDHKVFKSEEIEKLWGKGNIDFGSVTMDSANYVARYASKKLVHGDDGHEYEPVSKKSQRNAIGKKWLEKYHDDIFNLGYVVVDGIKMGVPRYYVKWLEKNHPGKYRTYLIKKAELDSQWERRKQKEYENDEKNYLKRLENYKKSRDNGKKPGPFVPEVNNNQSRQKIMEQKFKRLQNELKMR